MAANKPQSTKDEIWTSIGQDLVNDIEVYHNQVLVATWIRPERTAGGVILTDKSRAEDQWQGKVGLVVAYGPQAFVSDAAHDFSDQDVEVDDWIVYKVSDGFALNINDVHCRLLQDVEIRMRIKDPTTIY